MNFVGEIMLMFLDRRLFSLDYSGYSQTIKFANIFRFAYSYYYLQPDPFYLYTEDSYAYICEYLTFITGEL